LEDFKASTESPPPKPLKKIVFVFFICNVSETFKKLKIMGLLTPVSSRKVRATPLISTGTTIKLLINLNLILSDCFLF